MSSSVTTYVQPITQPLEGLYTSFTQLASQHRNMNDRLRSHKNDLVSNSAFPFQGDGATAFSDLVNHYLSISETNMQAFDDAARAVQICHSTITTASNSADGAGLHPGLTNHVLSQVTPNQIIQEGSSPIQAVISDMEQTLHDMASNAGGIFGNLIHFHFGAAFSDLMQEGKDIKNLAGDALGLLEDIGRVLGQWATSVFDAIKKCLPAIESALKTAADFFVKNWGNIKTILGVIGKFSKSVGDFLKKVGPYMKGISIIFNIIQGKDNSPKSLIGDLVATFALGAIPGVGEVALAFGAVSTGFQLLGDAQQNLIAPLIAKNDPALAKELSESGQMLTQDAQNINFGAVLKDVGEATYDINPLESGLGSVGQDIWNHPGDLFDPTKLKQSFKPDVNPGAALGDLKKAGGDLGGAFVSDFETGGDIANVVTNDVEAAKGNQAAVVANNQFTQQTWRPEIDSFKKWLASKI